MSRVASVLLALLLAALAAPAVARAQDATAGARADRQFAEDDYVAAEASYREALAGAPDDVHLLSRLALLLTWKGEYPEAIALYRKAIGYDASSMEARRGLATAYTWSEDYSRAIALYLELLGERPEDMGLMMGLAQARAWSGAFADAARTLRDLVGRDPANREARLLLAHVLYWDGDLDGAAAVYEAILADTPDDADALAGLGHVRRSQGRYKESLAALDRALAIDPTNREALEGRARTYQWQGRTTEALADVHRALELYPDARDARRIGSDIGGSLRPSLQLSGSTTQDSDDNDLATWGGTYTHYLGTRGYAGATFTHAQTDFQGLVAKYDTLRLIAGRHFSRFVSLYGEAGAEWTSFPFTDAGGNHDNETRSHGAGSLVLEVNGGDWFTLVAAASRDRLVGTTQAFINDVGIRAATLTALFVPHGSLRLSLMGQKAVFTDDSPADLASNAGTPEVDDDNRRDLATASATWRVPLDRPNLHLHYDFRWMSYDMTLDHGYFDPEHFVSNTVGFDLSDAIGRHVYWGGGMDYGFQRINDGDDDAVIAYRVLAGINIGDGASIEGYYAHSDLALQSTSGFTSTEAGVRLKIRFGSPLGPVAPRPGAAARPGGTTD